MITVAQALALFNEHLPPLPTERLRIHNALGRVAARAVATGINLPPFAQSAMDGFAVRASDLESAADAAPVRLERVGEVAAGDNGPLVQIDKGQAARIFTGARIPPGADAVVRQELVHMEGDRVFFKKPVARGKDIRPVGEELREGTRLIEPGERLDERHVGVLSMCGVAEIEAYRQPTIALLISGDEVVSPGTDLRPGEVYDANTPFLANWLRRRGYMDVRVVSLEDDPVAVERALNDALSSSDLVVSTGGVSVGDYDFFTDAADTLGLETVFWRVAQRPGKPLLFAKREQTAFLGIPGNPGAVFVSAYVYLQRVLDRLEGIESPGPTMQTGILAGDLRPSTRADSWVGCTLRVDEGGRVQLQPVQGHRMSALYRANVIAHIPAGDDMLAAGAPAKWFGLDGL